MVTVYECFGKLNESVIVSESILSKKKFLPIIVKLIKQKYPRFNKKDTLMLYLFEHVTLDEIGKQLPQIQSELFNLFRKNTLSAIYDRPMKVARFSKHKLTWLYHHPFFSINEAQEYVNFNCIESITDREVIFLHNRVHLKSYLSQLPVVHFHSIRFSHRLIINEVFMFRIPEILYIHNNHKPTMFVHKDILYKLLT